MGNAGFEGREVLIRGEVEEKGEGGGYDVVEKRGRRGGP